MPTLTYREQLLHPNWQRKRLEVLEDSGWACASCGTSDETLHVHHKRYVKGRLAWEYEKDQLVSLCKTCHDDDHKNLDTLHRLIAESSLGSSYTTALAAALLAGYLAGEDAISTELSTQAVIDGYQHEYQCGILAGLAAGGGWGQMSVAAEAVKPTALSPTQAEWLKRWEAA